MDREEKIETRPKTSNEGSGSPPNETYIHKEDSVFQNPEKGIFDSSGLVVTFMGITIAYLAVFTTPVLVSLGLQILQQAYGQSNDIAFVPASNTIGQCLGFLVVGRLADTIGRRWLVLAGNALSMIGYMVAGRAHNLATNIGGSFVFGIGVSIQLLAVMFALEFVPYNRRYLTYASIISAWGPIISIAAGTIFTFVATADQSWRWANYIAFIASFASLLIGLIYYHPQAEKAARNDSSKTYAVKNTDFIGTILWAGSTVSFLLGIYLGGQRYPWKSPRIIVPIVVGGVGWMLALAWEYFTRTKFASHVLPLLGQRNYTALTLAIAFVSMGWTAPTMLWSQQIVTIFGGDALLTGWYYGAALASPVLGQLIAGVMATGLPFLQPQLIIATILLVAFAPALAAYTLTQISMAITLIIVAGTGVGIAEIICVVGATSEVSVHKFGIASGFLWTVRRVATSIATAVYTTILKSKVEKNLTKKVVPVLAIGGVEPQAIALFLQGLLMGDLTAVSKIPGVTPEILVAASEAAKSAFADSFKVVYLTSIAFGLCGLAAAFMVKNSSLEKARTPKIARKLIEKSTGKLGIGSIF